MNMERIMLVAVAFAFAWLVLLGACTEMRWEKDGVDLATDNQDWTDCRNQAYQSAARQTWYLDPFPRTFLWHDQYGRPVAIYRYWPNSDRFMLEQEYLNSCLRQRGYRLVPVEPERRSPPG